MAIYIRILKRCEDACAALYDFGWIDRPVGTVSLDKQTGEVSVVELTDPPPADPDATFVVSCVRRKLRQHHEAGVYPDETAFRS